jgi:hypothetical protein
MTNPARLSGPRHLDSFIVTPYARPFTGTCKNHATATLTATNQTAGPLGLRESDKPGHPTHKSKSLAEAKHMLFFPISDYFMNTIH